MKTSGVLWLIIGAIVVIISLIAFSSSHIFFWIGLIFIVIGIFKLVSEFVLKDTLKQDLKKIEQMKPKFGRPCAKCGFPGRVEDSYCSKCGAALPPLKVK